MIGAFPSATLLGGGRERKQRCSTCAFGLYPMELKSIEYVRQRLCACLQAPHLAGLSWRDTPQTRCQMVGAVNVGIASHCAERRTTQRKLCAGGLGGHRRVAELAGQQCILERSVERIVHLLLKQDVEHQEQIVGSAEVTLATLHIPVLRVDEPNTKTLICLGDLVNTERGEGGGRTNKYGAVALVVTSVHLLFVRAHCSLVNEVCRQRMRKRQTSIVTSSLGPHMASLCSCRAALARSWSWQKAA